MNWIDFIFIKVVQFLDELGKYIVIAGTFIAIGLLVLLFICLIWGLML